MVKCHPGIWRVLWLLLPAAVQAQDMSAVEMTVHPVAGNVSYIEGYGGNIGLFTGPDGVFLIDDQYAPLTDKILAAAARAEASAGDGRPPLVDEDVEVLDGRLQLQQVLRVPRQVVDPGDVAPGVGVDGVP